MKNGKHVFNGLTQVIYLFPFFIYSSNLFVQLDRVLALYVSFPILLCFYFIHFICINLIIDTFAKPVHSSRFISFFSSFSYSLFPFSILSFLIYIFFIIAQSYPSISYVSLPRLSIYFPNFCYPFPYIMNNLVVCNPTTTTTFHPIYSAKIFQFRIAARNPSSIENMLHTSKSNLRSRFIEKRYRQRPRLSSHANSLLLVIY